MLSVPGTNTSTSTVSENTGSNDQLAIGSGTAYASQVGGNVANFNTSGSNLSGSVGADISTTINTEDPAVTGALSSAIDQLGSQGAAAVEALGTNGQLAEYLAATSGPQNPIGDNTGDGGKDSSNPIRAAQAGGLTPVVILLVIAAIYIVAVK